jgi:ATP-dependent Clp protease protease subunit
MAKVSRDHLDKMMDYGFDLDTRMMYFGGGLNYGIEEYFEVSAQTAERFIKGFMTLEHASTEKPITIILNNPGGHWQNGMAVYDMIKASPCEVTIKCMGECMSMATVILQAADIRESYPNTDFMVHDGYDGFYGRARDFERWAEKSKALRIKMYQIYAERTGQDVAYWRRKCADDYIMTAEKALEEKIIDRIIG